METYLTNHRILSPQAITELSGYLARSVIPAYLSDPDTKFILVERSPDAWVRSFGSTIGALAEAGAHDPVMRLSRHLDGHNAAVLAAAEAYNRCVAGGVAGLFPGRGGAAYRAALRRSYVEQ